MADKRMFSKKITDSDAFIELSSSAQALYFHLNQGADDDGFNNQIQNAMFKAHATVDDLKVLLLKNFLIRFECGVVVIKHWRIHNTLRKDRYKETNFQEELAALKIKDNGAYTLSDDTGCQLVAKRLPQNSIDKNSINNIYIVEDDNPKEEKSSSKNKDVKREIINYLNQKIGSDYRSTTKATVQLINARLKEGFNLEDFKKVIDNQYDKWFGTDMAQYLRPQTLFGTKFENYLNTPVKQKETSIERQDEDVYEILDMSEEEYWRSKRNNQ